MQVLRTGALILPFEKIKNKTDISQRVFTQENHLDIELVLVTFCFAYENVSLLRQSLSVLTLVRLNVFDKMNKPLFTY